LAILEIDGCPALKTLPSCVWNLEKLSCLRIADCSVESILLPAISLGKNADTQRRTASLSPLNNYNKIGHSTLRAQNLQSLMLNSISVCRLPDELGSLQNLTSLKIFCCPELEALPSTLSNLQNLSLLEISACSALKRLPTDLQKLENLETLSLNMCPELCSIETFPRHVECLKIKNLSSLRALPSQIGDLSDLTTLIIGDCHNLVEIPSEIGRLGRLSYLDISHCAGLPELPAEVLDLGKLQTLRICSCRGIQSMPPSLRPLTALEDLKVSRCTQMTQLPADLDQLPNLEKLDLSYCQRDALFDLFAHKWNEKCSLKDLSLEGCRVGDDFFTKILANLPTKLIALDLDDTGITSLDGFFSSKSGHGLPRGIVDLDLSNSPFLEYSDSKYHQSSLERLLERYPCLEYIGTNDDESSFSLQTYFMLRFNEAGRALLRSDGLKPSIPAYLWPYVLSRVQNVVQHVGRNDSKCMEASILFEFLHGPVMLDSR